jgi:hypothetical protein
VKIKITELPTFYINLDDRPDRRARVESILSNYGFSNYERFPGVKAGKRVGCSTSHSQLLQKIIDEDIYPALVLEDDIEVFQNFIEEIECPDDADAMYLGVSCYGYNHDKSSKGLKISELGDSYHRMHNMLARHAIIHFNKEYDRVSIDLMNNFISNPEEYIAGDVTLSSMHPRYKVYAQNIPLFYQRQEATQHLTKRTIFDCGYIETDKV